MEKTIRSLKSMLLTFLLITGSCLFLLCLPVSASNGFTYNHDPRENCKAMQDIVADPNAVYGFVPSPTGSLKLYATYDWTDAALVASAKESRIAYLKQLNTMYDKWDEMKNQGASDYEIAVVICNLRNQIRLDSYKDDPEGLAKCKARNLEKYGDENGPSAEYIYTHNNKSSWLEVIYSAFSTNSGMDALLGLYDDEYENNLKTGSIKAHTFDQGVVTREATETTDGILTKTCTVCGTQFTQTIPATGKTELSPAEKSKITLDAKFNVSFRKSKIVVKWGKVSGAVSYEIYAAYCGTQPLKKVKTVKGTSTTCTLSKIGNKVWNQKGKLKLYVAAIDKQGNVICLSLSAHVAGLKNKTFTNAKSLTVSKNSYVIKSSKTKKITCKTTRYASSKKLLSRDHVGKYRYASSNPYIASVSAKGVIRGIRAGTCTVYVYAQNGISKKIKVTVK